MHRVMETLKAESNMEVESPKPTPGKHKKVSKKEEKKTPEKIPESKKKDKKKDKKLKA